MGLALDDVPYEPATEYTDRWVFALEDTLEGEHGGTFFVAGVAERSVDVRCLRKFICAHVVEGARRVFGARLDLGDTSKLKGDSKPDGGEGEGETDPNAPTGGTLPAIPGIDNALPGEQPGIDNTLPPEVPPIGTTLPTRPGVDNELPGEQPGIDNALPPERPPLGVTLPEGPRPGNELPLPELPEELPPVGVTLPERPEGGNLPAIPEAGQELPDPEPILDNELPGERPPIGTTLPTRPEGGTLPEMPEGGQALPTPEPPPAVRERAPNWSEKLKGKKGK
jgi:hypothetical protein